MWCASRVFLPSRCARPVRRTSCSQALTWVLAQARTASCPMRWRSWVTRNSASSASLRSPAVSSTAASSDDMRLRICGRLLKRRSISSSLIWLLSVISGLSLHWTARTLRHISLNRTPKRLSQIELCHNAGLCENSFAGILIKKVLYVRGHKNRWQTIQSCCRRKN